MLFTLDAKWGDMFNVGRQVDRFIWCLCLCLFENRRARQSPAVISHARSTISKVCEQYSFAIAIFFPYFDFILWLQSFNKHHLLALTPLCCAKVYRDERFKASISGITWHGRNWERSRSGPRILSCKSKGFRGLKTTRYAYVIKCTGLVCFSEEIFGVTLSVHKWLANLPYVS